MAYLELSNFKPGLDTRRSELTSQPGTLETLLNGHINQGGQIEKRKAFVKYDLPASTFGMVQGKDTIYVFGSVDQTGQTFPAFVTYQRLVHPTGAAMTAVLSARLISGKTFVLAKFDTNEVLAFYDTVAVDDITAGMIWDGASTVSALIAKIAAQINATEVVNGKTEAKYPYTASVNGDVLTVASVPSDASPGQFSAVTTVDSAQGVVDQALVGTGTPSIPGTVAQGSFIVTAGTINTQAYADFVSTTGNNVGNNETVTIGTIVYTFVSSLTGANLYAVKIGATKADSLLNLFSAIQAQTGSGTRWSTGTPAHPDVVPTNLAATQFRVKAIAGGVVGNNIAVSETCASMQWDHTVGGKLSGGTDDNYIDSIQVGTVADILAANVPYAGTPETTATAIAAEINANTTASGFNATSVGSLVNIFSNEVGTAFNNLDITVTVVGALCIDAASFIVSGTGNISVIAGPGGTPANMLTATITFRDGGHPTETLVQFCQRVVANLNANSGVSGYVSVADNSTPLIHVSPAVCASSDATARSIATTATLTITESAVAITATLSTTLLVIPFGGTAASDFVTVTVIGGTAPYIYAWSCLTSPAKARATRPNSNRTAFSVSLQGSLSGSFTEEWICTITDSTSPTANVVVTDRVTVQRTV